MASTTPRVTLDPMTQAEFDSFSESAIRDYAQDKVESGHWAAEESLELSRLDHERLLPDGLKTADMYLYTVRDAESGEPAGILWLALRMLAGRIECYVYNIEVREQLRGRGYGRATMRKAIEEARELQAETVGLHVFGKNAPARALYKSLGFVETSVVMSLDLDPKS